MNATQFFSTLLGLLIITSLWKIYLEINNVNSAIRGTIGDANKNAEQKDEEKQKALSYTKSKANFTIARILYTTALLVVLCFSPILVESYQQHIAFWGTSSLSLAGYLYAITLAWSALFLPFELYHTFVLEERFGFNTSSLSIFIADKIKEILLGLILFLPLLSALFYLEKVFPKFWWIIAACIFVGFQFLLQVIYPRLILPLFFKFSPLPDENLKKELFSLAKKADFPAKDILVIDGSRRSRHSNAFFSGLGKSRMVVLFDTLLQQLSTGELKAVLAHEIGHYKKNHIFQMISLSVIQTFLAIFLISWLMEQPFFLNAFGFETSLLAPTIAIFFFFGSLFSYWISPLKNILLRKYEFEADQFALNQMGKKTQLIDALKKLHQENLSNLYPSKIYCVFYYSHPTLEERERALAEKERALLSPVKI